MTKGVREFAIAKFNELVPQLKELGNTKFRKAVMAAIMEKCDVSLASAATHYNHALKNAKANAPASVEGLGRPEDKKGGRKPIHLVNVIKVKTGEMVAEGISRAQAAELVRQAEAKKKAKLEIQEVKKAEPAATEQTAEGAQAEATAETSTEAASTEAATA